MHDAHATLHQQARNPGEERVVAEGDAQDEQREGADDRDDDQRRLPQGFLGDA